MPIVIRALLCAGLLVAVASVAEEKVDPAVLAAHETAAAAGCKAYAEAQEIYRRTDYDGDGILEYSQCIRGGQKKLDTAPPMDLEKLPKPTDDEIKTMQALIKAMGADDFNERQKANDALKQFGTKALAVLQKATTEEKDAEINSRCKKLIVDINDALSPAPKHDIWFGLCYFGERMLGLVDKTFAQAECCEGVDPAKCTPKAGYLFRILYKQGKNATGGARDYIVKGNMTLGYAVLAFPKEYGKTGAKCFMINNNGTIYEKDFGSKEKFDEFLKNCKEFDPDQSWKISE